MRIVNRTRTGSRSRLPWIFVGLAVGALASAEEPGARPGVAIRGMYGGVPTELLVGGRSLADAGINAVWVGSDALNSTRIEPLKRQGVKVFAEFNTMHDASYLDDHPDARPVGSDGQPCPPPDGWQGVCPTHPGYRAARMGAFRRALADHAIDGIWLDYHHAHASWEQAAPKLPETCFCNRCLDRFERETGLDLPEGSTSDRARRLLGPLKEQWVAWRCAIFTDWVRQFRALRDETRPSALLGTFHCPWSEDDFGGALRQKLAIDLKAQAAYLDVLSPMPYHARFGHPDDPAWISRQVRWLGRYLGLEGKPGERLKIWPIVQLSDWGEPVPATQVSAVVDHGTRPPATGVTVFNWGSLHQELDKVERLARSYRSLRP
jgi:hypothetical protein